MKRKFDVSYAKIDPKLVMILKKEGLVKKADDGRYFGITGVANTAIKNYILHRNNRRNTAAKRKLNKGV
jgi:hypothetical protein